MRKPVIVTLGLAAIGVLAFVGWRRARDGAYDLELVHAISGANDAERHRAIRRLAGRNPSALVDELHRLARFQGEEPSRVWIDCMRAVSMNCPRVIGPLVAACGDADTIFRVDDGVAEAFYARDRETSDEWERKFARAMAELLETTSGPGREFLWTFLELCEDSHRAPAMMKIVGSKEYKEHERRRAAVELSQSVQFGVDDDLEPLAAQLRDVIRSESGLLKGLCLELVQIFGFLESNDAAVLVELLRSTDVNNRRSGLRVLSRVQPEFKIGLLMQEGWRDTKVSAEEIAEALTIELRGGTAKDCWCEYFRSAIDEYNGPAAEKQRAYTIWEKNCGD